MGTTINLASQGVVDNGTQFGLTGWSTSVCRPGIQSNVPAYGVCRFASGADIPQGATIDSATLTVETETFTDAAQDIPFVLYGDDKDSSQEFGASPNLPSERTPTTTNVTGTFIAASGAIPYAFDVADIVQEIVNRAGWESGNPISLIFEGTEAVLNNKYVTLDQFGEPDPPTLDVTYSVASAGGIRGRAGGAIRVRGR